MPTTPADLHVRLSQKLRDDLAIEAEERGLSLSKLIERACSDWLDHNALSVAR